MAMVEVVRLAVVLVVVTNGGGSCGGGGAVDGEVEWSLVDAGGRAINGFNLSRSILIR